ncbi:unnamed protein product [Porites evermanni]|uniref:RRM domain-containing protein n=1 Tax=Porites evermanni TaxID=104178 RepID=A0ABN8RX36_9CNID|nr:unnamed protein product [Porites evermanni]
MASSRAQLFVAKLPWTVCRDTLREYFQKFGVVTSSRVVFDYKSGRSKKYGFVEFDSPASAEKALNEPSHFIDGSKVFIQSKVNEREMKRQPQQQRSEETNQGAADFSEV